LQQDLKKHLVTISLDMGHQRVPYNPCANHTFTPTSRKVDDVDAMLYYDGSLEVKDCCIKSAAAPTYFPSYKGQVDGGMFANVGQQYNTVCILHSFRA
jgi:patatin-like phospholipase/acyl hydrolase